MQSMIGAQEVATAPTSRSPRNQSSHDNGEMGQLVFLFFSAVGSGQEAISRFRPPETQLQPDKKTITNVSGQDGRNLIANTTLYRSF